jgi:hypothetical protein
MPIYNSQGEFARELTEQEKQARNALLKWAERLNKSWKLINGLAHSRGFF